MFVWLSFLLFSLSWWCVTQNMHLSHTSCQLHCKSLLEVTQLSTKLQQWGKLRKDKQGKLSALEFLISRAWSQWVFCALPGVLAVPFCGPGCGPHHHPPGAVPLLLLRSPGSALSLWAPWPDHDQCFPGQPRGNQMPSWNWFIMEKRGKCSLLGGV